MDPFSITVGTITLIAAVKKSLDCLKKLRHKSQGLDALIQETSDLGLVLEHVESFLQAPESCDQDEARRRSEDFGLSQILERARSTLIEIEDLVDKNFRSRTKRFAYPKAVSELERKRQDLQTVRYNLNVVLSVVSS